VILGLTDKDILEEAETSLTAHLHLKDILFVNANEEISIS